MWLTLVTSLVFGQSSEDKSGFVESIAFDAPANQRTDATHHADDVGFILRFLEPGDEDEARMKRLLEQEDGVPDMVALFNALFILKAPLTVKVGAEDGPYYEPGAEVITIPYAFALEIEQRFQEQGDPARVNLEESDDLVLDVVMHTLFHELGHALMWQYELPLFFEEEDVVDSLANLLLLDYTENGQQVAISAAEMYRLEAADIERFEAADFWNEHSLDIQRHYDVYCAIYGADPEGNQRIIDEVFDASEEQGDVCIDTYTRIANSWAPLLEPILRE